MRPQKRSRIYFVLSSSTFVVARFEIIVPRFYRYNGSGFYFCCFFAQVLEQVRDELVDCGCGISVMELSHRSSEYAAINNNAIGLYRELL